MPMAINVNSMIVPVADIARTISDKAIEIAEHIKIRGWDAKNTNSRANSRALECSRSVADLSL